MGSGPRKLSRPMCARPVSCRSVGRARPAAPWNLQPHRQHKSRRAVPALRQATARATMSNNSPKAISTTCALTTPHPCVGRALPAAPPASATISPTQKAGGQCPPYAKPRACAPRCRTIRRKPSRTTCAHTTPRPCVGRALPAAPPASATISPTQEPAGSAHPTQPGRRAQSTGCPRSASRGGASNRPVALRLSRVPGCRRIQNARAAAGSSGSIRCARPTADQTRCHGRRPG